MMRKREPAAICMCTSKTLIITVIIFFFKGDSCNVSYYNVQEVNVSVGEVAEMSFCRPNDTSECFGFYRVTKNWNEVIFTLNAGSERAN